MCWRAPLEAFNAWSLGGRPFVGGDQPSIADMRWAATLEFLRAIDYDFPPWADEYMARMEEALGDAYSEPVADVRATSTTRGSAGRLVDPRAATGSSRAALRHATPLLVA